MSTLKKIDDVVNFFNKVARTALLLKKNAVTIENHEFAIAAQEVLTAANNMAQLLLRERGALKARLLDKGEIRDVPIENLNKTKLRLVKGGAKWQK